MLNNTDTLIAQLRQLNLTTIEARIYLELLKEPSTHLRLSHATGINRSKVYRVAEQLERRSLIARRTDDRGTFLVATDPATLEVQLISQEERLQAQRKTLRQILPTLGALQASDPSSFIIRTYEGRAGLKQMCWHELKTKGELVAFGYGTIELIIDDHLWADRHRARQLAARYSIRELVNESEVNGVDGNRPPLADDSIIKSNLYTARVLPEGILDMRSSQTIIYNDTVAIYHYKRDQKVGIEIISQPYADMFRQLFEKFWAISSPYIF